MRRMVMLAAGVVFLLVSTMTYAHHAGVLYDREHVVTVSGTVTEFNFTNPHVAIHFEAKDENGNVAKWVAESAGPQRLLRSGWNKFSLKPGDHITVTGAQFKDGRKILSIVKLVGGSVPVLTLGAAE